MTIKELEQYCINKSIECVGKSQKHDEEEGAYYRGMAQAFMWIAAKIQNEVNIHYCDFAVAVENHPADSRVKISEDGISV